MNGMDNNQPKPERKLPRPRLLFVDDDPGVLSALSRFMRRYRFDVSTAADAFEGLRKVEENGPFHLIVSDYRMPGMTGELFLSRVAEIAPDTRRMILSAFADSQLLLAAINAGRVHRYLTKPWDSRELLAVVRELVDEYNRRTSLNYEVQHLADANQHLEQAIEQNQHQLEAQGRSLHESNRRLHLLSAHLEKVREEERRAVARDIHDDLGQTLTAMNLEVATLLRLGEGGELTPRLQTLKSHLELTIGTVQRIISSMRSQVLDELGLEAAIEGLARDVRGRGGMKCIVSCQLAGVPLSYGVAECLYRITQESLTNVMRHSKATKVLVTLRNRDAWWLLQIRDNGTGITEAQSCAPDSFGLMGMRERVARCGGSFSISPGLGGGTIVEAQLPEACQESFE